MLQVSYRWTVERFLQGWCPDPIPASLRFPPAPVVPEVVVFLVDDEVNFLVDDEDNNLTA